PVSEAFARFTVPRRTLSIAAAASRCMSGSTWLYVSSVIAMLEWPSRSLTTFAGTLAFSMSVAAVSQIVEPKRREAGTLDDPAKPSRDRVLAYRPDGTERRLGSLATMTPEQILARRVWLEERYTDF